MLWVFQPEGEGELNATCEDSGTQDYSMLTLRWPWHPHMKPCLAFKACIAEHKRTQGGLTLLLHFLLLLLPLWLGLLLLLLLLLLLQ